MHCKTFGNYLPIVRLAVEDVLHARGLPLDATLADLGATSLDIIELIMMLEERLEIDLPDDILGRETTLRLLAVTLWSHLGPPVTRSRA